MILALLTYFISVAGPINNVQSGNSDHEHYTNHIKYLLKALVIHLQISSNVRHQLVRQKTSLRPKN